MSANGTVTRIVVNVLDKVTDPADFDTVNVNGTVYVSDDLNSPRPGLPIDLGETDIASVATLLAHSSSDLYTFATTGSF